MKYYKVMFDNENAKNDEITCMASKDFEEKYSIRKNDLFQGEHIENWNEMTTLSYNKTEGDVPTDLLGNSFLWLIVSEKIQNAIVSLEVKNTQLLPITIVEECTSEKIMGYSVLNVTTLTEAMDYDHSDYNVFKSKKGEMLSVTKLAIKKEAVVGLDLVRVKEWKFATLISERLKDAIQKTNPTGIDFLEVKVV